MGCQGKRSGLTAHGGVVHLPMPCQSFLLLHRFLFLLSFLLLSFQDLTIEGLFMEQLCIPYCITVRGKEQLLYLEQWLTISLAAMQRRFSSRTWRMSRL